MKYCYMKNATPLEEDEDDELNATILIFISLYYIKKLLKSTYFFYLTKTLNKTFTFKTILVKVISAKEKMEPTNTDLHIT